MSGEMLSKLKEKAPNARVVQADVTEYCPDETFDYIFISSGSVSLFTDMDLCRKLLYQLKGLLAPEGRLVFAVDTIANRCPDDSGYSVSASVKTKDGLDLVLKSKNTFDPSSQTQFSPGIYELYQGTTLLQSEEMDFQTHLYRFGEMERCVAELGFPSVKTYSSFLKTLLLIIRRKCFYLNAASEPGSHLPSPAFGGSGLRRQGGNSDMTEIRYVQMADRGFWSHLDRHLTEGEFAAKVRDKRGYVLLEGQQPVGLLRYHLFWDNTPFVLCSLSTRDSRAGAMAGS